MCKLNIYINITRKKGIEPLTTVLKTVVLPLNYFLIEYFIYKTYLSGVGLSGVGLSGVGLSDVGLSDVKLYSAASSFAACFAFSVASAWNAAFVWCVFQTCVLKYSSKGPPNSGPVSIYLFIFKLRRI